MDWSEDEPMAKRDMVLSLSEMVKHLLDCREIPYEVWDRGDYLTILHAVVASGFGGGGRLARVVFLRDPQGLVMALINEPEDTATPARHLNRPLTPALPFELLETDRPEAELWVDPVFRNAEVLVLDVGSGQEVIQVHREALEDGFCRDEGSVAELQVYELLARIALESPTPSPLWDLGERLQQLDDLPSLTPFGRGVLELYLAPRPDPEALLTLIAREALSQTGYPHLSPVLSRIARRLEHESETPGVWEESLHLAMGHALSQQFPVAAKGMLGAPWCWRHFLLTARLCEGLARLSPLGLEPRKAGLAGWLHDVGHLYLAQSFPREFSFFNHIVERYSHRPIIELERHLLGVNHCDLGAALLHHWELAAELVEAVRHHHRPEIAEGESTYAELLLIADRLAHRHDGGDAISSIVPPWLMERHGLSAGSLNQVLADSRHDLSLLDGLSQGAA